VICHSVHHYVNSNNWFASWFHTSQAYFHGAVTLIDDSSDHLGSILPLSLTSLSLFIDPIWKEKGDWPAVVVDLLGFVPLLKKLCMTVIERGASGEETVRVACVMAGVEFELIEA